MLVRVSINEPDVTAMLANSKVSVHLDAYPDLTLPAHFLSASPVASSGMGTPIKDVRALFGLDKSDPHLLPDLSAAVVLTLPPVPPAASIPAGGKNEESLRKIRLWLIRLCILLLLAGAGFGVYRFRTGQVGSASADRSGA